MSKTKLFIFKLTILVLTTFLLIFIAVPFLQPKVEAESNMHEQDYEISIALNNLYCKFDSNDYPVFVNKINLKDFNEEELYSLYNFIDYYMIVIRNTGTILERGNGASKYAGLAGELYYGGFFKAYHKINNNILDENNNYVSAELIIEMRENMRNIREIDYCDYIEAINTPVAYGEANRSNINYLGNSRSKYEYFSKKINIYYQYHSSIDGSLKNPPYNNTSYVTISNCLYTVEGRSAQNYGTVYYRQFNEEYDLFYPKNVYNSCSLITMTMLLQYYDRLDIDHSIINNISYNTNENIIRSNPWLYSKSERIMKELYSKIYMLDGIGEYFDGAATYANIDSAFERYFNENNIVCESKSFTSYTNVKGAIDSGNPVILTIGAGRGFYKNYGESGYNTIDLSGHNVVAYGYTKNSIGVMDEFIVHANWQVNDNNYAEVFMNKLYTAGNCYLDIS